MISENGDAGFHDEFDPGEGTGGVWPGGVYWKADTLAGGVDLDSLTFPGGASGVAGVWSNRNSTRFQVKTQTALFDAQEGTNQVVVKIFPIGQVGPLVGGFHDQAGKTADSTTTYLLASGKLQIMKTDVEENPVTMYTLEHDLPTGKRTWTDELAGIRKASTFVETAGTNPGDLEREITHEEWRRLPASTVYELISREKTIYINDWREGSAPGWYPVETINDPGGADISTLTWYDEETAEWSIQRNSDGSWVSRSRYGDLGIVGADGLPDYNWTAESGVSINSVVYRPWLDSTLPSSGVPAGDSCLAELDISLNGTDIKRKETRILGMVTRRVDTWSENLQEGGSGPYYKVQHIRNWNSGTAGDYLESSTWTHTSGDWSGRTYKTVAEDGTVRKFAYASGPYSTPSGVSPAFTGTCVTTVEQLEGSGLRNVRIMDEDDRLREEREEINTGGSTWEEMTEDIHAYQIDLTGRLLSESTFKNRILVGKTTYVSSTETLEESMGSPAIRTIEDGEGNVLSVSEEVPGRADIVTTYTRAGRTKTVTRTAGDLSESTVTVVDVAGRTVSTRDEGELVTTVIPDEANRTTTTIRPGGATEISKTYRDGQQKSIDGTGVIPSNFLYGRDVDGFLYSIESTGSATLSTPRNLIQLRDWRGRTKMITRPSPALFGNSVTETHGYHDTTGQLTGVGRSTGIGSQVYAYDSLGRITLSGTDGNANATANLLSSDRLTGTSTTHEKVGGIWWEVTTTRQYHTDGSATAYETTERRAMKPVDLGGGWGRWTSIRIGPGTVSVTTHRDEKLETQEVLETTDSTATTITTDSVARSVGGRVVSFSEFGSAAPSTYGYDALGRMTLVTDPRGGIRRTTYNAAGQVVRTSDSVRNTQTTEYYPASHPSAGLPWKVTNGEGETTEYTYNLRGDVLTTRGTAVYPITYTYTPYGELHTLTTYGTGASGETTTWTRDPASGVLTEKVYPDGKKTSYTYHAHGGVHTRTWARAKSGVPVKATYSYNVFGDLTGVSYSDGTPGWSGTSDRIGRPKTRSEGGGANENFTYGPVVPGQAGVTYPATHAWLPGVTLERTWNQGNGRLLGSGIRRSLTWDQRAGYLYDPTGRFAGVNELIAGTISHRYSFVTGTRVISKIEHRNGVPMFATQHRGTDLAGRLYSVETRGSSGNLLQRHAYKYDLAGRRTKLTREDGAYWDYGYNDRGEVISGMKRLPGGGLLAGHQFKYDYDEIGNRNLVYSGGNENGELLRTTAYWSNSLNQYNQIQTQGSFDVLGRTPAASVTVNGAAALKQGNRFRSQISTANTAGAVWQPVTVNDGVSAPVSGNRYVPKETVSSGVNGLQYDEDGNLTSDGRWLYEWDAENRLVVMKTNTATQASGEPYVRLVFAYDWMGRRMRKQVFNSPGATTPVEDRRFAYDGWNLVVEYTASGTTLTPQRNYTWGIDLSGSLQGAGGVGGLLAVHQGVASALAGVSAYDANGNITGWLDSAGQMTARMEYDPFGNQIVREGTINTSFGFSTKYEDKETGLLYYGYRYYDPMMGRWLSRDPIGHEGGFNVCAFDGNDPVNHADHLGLFTQEFRSSRERWASTCAEKYDRWSHLAIRLGLAESEASKWVKNYDAIPVEGKKYYIPNVAVVYTNKWDAWDYRNVGIIMAKRYASSRARVYRAKGYYLIKKYDQEYDASFLSVWKEEGLTALTMAGHGAELGWNTEYVGFITEWSNPGWFEGNLPLVTRSGHTDYGNKYYLSEIHAIHCLANSSFWENKVSHNGWVTAAYDNFGFGPGSSFRWEYIRGKGK